MADPTSKADAEREARIVARARQMWEADGRPAGQEAEFFERARELLAIEENPGAGQLPNPSAGGHLPPDTPGSEGDLILPKPGSTVIEEADIQENLGEFPGAFTDQGDRQQTPSSRRRRSRR